MRKRALRFVCCILLFFTLPWLDAGAAPVCTVITNVSGASGPWNFSANLNANYPYGVSGNINLPPTVVDRSSGLAFTAGDTLCIQSLTPGQLTLCLGAEGTAWCDAGGAISWGILYPGPPYTDTGPPGQYTLTTTYGEELLGAFADGNGEIIPPPFAIGNGTAVTIPAGAAQLLMGVNDSWYNDNCGSVGVCITEGCINCSNVTIQLVSSNYNVFSACPAAWQGVWQVSDCCSNTTTCTQFVSVWCCPITNLPSSCCPETNGVKYVQNPDLNNGIDVNATFSAPDPVDGFVWVLADDFPCTNSGPITDLHLWGSWLNDQVDYNAVYTLAIWSDVPANEGAFSHPGQRLWTQTYGPGQYTLCLYANQVENFFDGDSALNGFPTQLGRSTNLYYLCFDVNPTNVFYQTGTTNAPTNYWLSVTVQASIDPRLYFGWKSSATAYNDAAVAAFNGNFYPLPGDWNPMTDAQGAPLNLAFKITTATNPCTLTLACPANLVVYSCTNVPETYTPTATESCSNCPVNVVCTPPSGSSFAPGTTTPVNCVATDCYGNTAACSFTVTVQWATNCCCSCISNILVNGDFEDEPYFGVENDVDVFMSNPYVTAVTGDRLPGWTIAPNHWVTIHRSGGGISPYYAYTISGQYSVNTDGEGFDMNTYTGPGSLSYGNNALFYQDFSSVAGQVYTLSFDWETFDQPPYNFASMPDTELEVSVADNSGAGAKLFDGLYAYNAATRLQVQHVNTSFTGTGHPLRLQIQETPQSGVNDDLFVVDNFCVSVSSNCCVPPPTNMVLWLPFDETTGPTSANLASPANLGTQVGGPGVVLGAYVANSLSFNGVNQYVTVPDYPAIEIGTNDFTIDAWVNRATNGPDSLPSVIVDKRDVNSGVGYSLSVSYGHLVLTMAMANNTTSINYEDTGFYPVPPDGLWHFVAVSVSQSASSPQVSFYIDGALNSTLAVTPTDVANTNSFWVGASPVSGNRPWLGDLDEVELYNRALSASELQRIFYAGPAGKCKTNCLQALVLNCATNRFFPCPTNWTFDNPIVSDPCCGTNYTLTFSDTTSSVGCSNVFTRTWQVTDCLNRTAACSQTVTVVNPPPPVLTCVGDKTVQAGTPWSFDPPTVSAPCCSNNLTLIAFPPQTNGNCCTQLISEVWQATCCSNSVTCTQTVTVLCTTPPVLTCAGDKTVQAGTPWSFTPPIVSAPCGCSNNNVTLIALPPQTNGNCCTQFISEVWQATCCSNTVTCTQTVTVVDTTPPAIVCPASFILVPLDANCRFTIPTIPVHGSGGCPPLVYAQAPPAGTIISCHCPSPCPPCPACYEMVTVTVSDQCHRTNLCQVRVYGVDETPPKLVCPSSLTVTNCLVPNALPYVSATDNCTPASQLVFSQWPEANTSLCAGMDSVTVTVTDCAGNSASHSIPLNISGPISFLANLADTGVALNGSLLANEAVDPHYTLTYVPAGMPPGWVSPTAVAVICPWGLPDIVSEWLSPVPNCFTSGPFGVSYPPSCPPGLYTYRYTFTLPGWADSATASISGRWAAADGPATMYLNGVQVSQISPPAYNHWTSFSTPLNSFVPANNTMTFVVTNTASWGGKGYTGLKVEFTSARANCCTCAPPVIVYMTPSQNLPWCPGSTVNAVFTVTASGLPPLSYQWYYNGSLIPGATGSTLKIFGVTPAANGGAYFVRVCDGCGCTDSPTRTLRVNYDPYGCQHMQWAWWNVAQLDNPMAATVGPDLILAGTNTLAIAAGTTTDFGLPELGGQVVNVMDIPPLPGDTTIQLPLIAAPGSNSVSQYTLLMDVYCPSNSSGTTRTLFVNGPLPGGLTWTIDPDDISRATVSVGGTNMQAASPVAVALDQYHRAALVLANRCSDGTRSLEMYLDGQLVASASAAAAGGPIPGLDIDWSNSPPTLLSSSVGTSGELYVSSIQFRAAAMTPDMLAALGSPDNGPLPANVPFMAPQPVLSATVSNGVANLAWSGSFFVLQEATDLASGVWGDSALPFTESLVGDQIVTTAAANPATEGPSKFYRLIFRP